MSDDDEEIEDDDEECEIDVYVIDKDGDAVYNEKVTIFYGTFGGFEDDYTDEDGHVTFNIPKRTTANRHYSSIYFYVNNVKYEYEDVECGDGFTVTMDDD